MSGTPIDPVATYRVQLTPEFTFAEVAGILDHLRDLGISHLYLSPILTAMPGSTHGYDWCPPARISDVLGGADGYRLLREHARARGIGIIVDIVPNHVGVADPDHNPWWADVLVHGLHSPYAGYFDLDTAPVGGVINLPYLGREEDLAGLRLDDRLRLVLGDLALPTAPGTATPGDDPLAVHLRQHYRLVLHDSRRVGYRRFMAVNGLAALRQEIPEVYDATHAWLQELIADDLVDGVRVDHVDGLRDPTAYLRRLRADLGDDRLLYVEKGLAHDERLDPDLPVDGTTGYDQLRLIEARFTAPTGAIELDETFRTVLGIAGDGDVLGARALALRRTVLVDMFPDRLQRVTDQLSSSARDVPAHIIQQAAALEICSAAVARPDYPSLSARVIANIDRLADENPILASGFDVLREAFVDRDFAPEAIARIGEAAVAVYGKAIEDIGFHRTARLVSSQELGCNPLVPAIDRTDFYARTTERAAHWPRAMTALSTHDTKRSEDVRARIATIAQTPQRWRILVNEVWRIAPPPEPVICYFLLQNVVGVWPVGSRPDADLARRLADFARKAMRENGEVSSWTDVDEKAEDAVQHWLAGLQHGLVAELVASFVALIADAGHAESISRKALSLLLPGVGDVYQGTQWWDDSLTDPDNRRPVDYDRSTDHPKLRAVRTCLEVRRRHLEAFDEGSDFLDVPVRGASAAHVVSFARGRAGVAEVVVVAVRLALMFTGAEIREQCVIDLPGGTWCDALSGNAFTESVTADFLLGDRPLAVLERYDDA
ncbi:malto-oligosyltrehalose synthase [Gordonia neofelifaecis]|uniref:Malto-oligosyltrehalose synthase n=1 Tax=Gordonia neofelifaecis NRRL B-59395 TaxID=644548 RepID=F1YHQ4_9ACTN|nr:malto-oligosyltrehalose synthase [Gordonia neofelifaecis]EGD55892.1 malto-oligosyltrehalose synthase [Gordonia neofelifaecis NRRL B-59395]